MTEPTQSARDEVRRLHKAQLPAVVLTSRERIEEGYITAVDAEGFRIGPLGHWVWWPDLERVGEKKR